MINTHTFFLTKHSCHTLDSSQSKWIYEKKFKWISASVHKLARLSTASYRVAPCSDPHCWHRVEDIRSDHLCHDICLKTNSDQHFQCQLEEKDKLFQILNLTKLLSIDLKSVSWMPSPLNTVSSTLQTQSLCWISTLAIIFPYSLSTFITKEKSAGFDFKKWPW